MWLKVGSYPERELAMEIASKLRNAGARVEIKEFVDWEIDEKYILHTRLDELEDHDAREWKKYIEVLRDLVNKGMDVENFEREFLKKTHPAEFELTEKLAQNSITDDEFIDAVEAALRLSFVMSSIYSFLKLNGVEVEDRVYGELPENPEIVIEVDDEVEGSKKVYYLEFVPTWDVSVDIMSVIQNEIEIEGMEGMAIDAASRVLLNLLIGVEETGNVESLEDYAVGVLETEEGEVYVDAEDALETMLKSLEKSGIVRIAGKKIRLRK